MDRRMGHDAPHFTRGDQLSVSGYTKNATIKTVISGLLYRYENMKRANHPGWRTSSRFHNDDIRRVEMRVMDVIAATFDDDELPDVLHVTHGRSIYRIDYAEGSFGLIGTLTVDLTTTVTPAIEAN
jgi:hypothetical protein